MAKTSKNTSPDKAPPEEALIIDAEIQPRAVYPEEQAVEPYFRAALYAERQKLGKTPEELQLLLGEDTDGIENQAVGLDLTVSEDRALQAIQKKLHKTGYEGNEPGRHIYSSAYKYDGYLPVVSMSYSEYYSLYGLKSDDDGLYCGGEREQALEALRGIARPFMITEDKKPSGKYKDGKPLYDVVRATTSLIKLREDFQDLTEEEVRLVETGHDLPDKRHTMLTVEVSPLLVDLIDEMHIRMSPTLHDDIKELKGSKRPSRAISLFIEYLSTLNIQEISVSKEKLAYRLRLDGYIRQRKQSMIDKRIQEALDYALELEYLLDYQEKPTGLLTLRLNPEKCGRVKDKLARKKRLKKETG